MRIPNKVFTACIIVAACLMVAFVIGCTAAQLNRANADIGGAPLATTQPTALQAGANLVGNVASSPVVTTAAASVPFPWNAAIYTVLGITTAVAGALAGVQTSKLQTTKNVITAAAPGVAQLVKQVTDNQTLASDVTEIGQLAPGVISFLTHPSAVAATGGIVPKAAA